MNAVKSGFMSLVPPSAADRAGSDAADALRGSRERPTVAAPSVPKPRARWKTRVLVPAVVLFSFVALLAYAGRAAIWPSVDVRVVPVVVKVRHGAPPASGQQSNARPADGPGPVLVQAPGWIEPSPYATSVPALVEGVVREVLVLEGEHVETGQVIARLDDAEETLRANSGIAVVAERESEVRRAQSGVEQARAQVAVERSVAAELSYEVERKRDLVALGGISAGDYRRMEIRLQGLEARIAVAEQAVHQAAADVSQAQAGVQIARANLAEALLKRDRTVVVSSASGVVMTRLVEPGSRISMAGRPGETGGTSSMSGAVIRIYDPAKLQVRVDVPLADAAKVGIGTIAQITTEALPDRVFAGEVTRVMHEANIQRNTVQFKVAISDPVATLKPEMLARVRLYAPRAEPAAAVPGNDARVGTDDAHGHGGTPALFLSVSALVERSGSAAKVWLVSIGDSAGPVATLQEVSLGSEDAEGNVEITRGLRAGDRVVADAPPSLRPGMRLRVLGEVPTSNAGDR